MSTANFVSQKDFPLFVAENIYSKRCPECGCMMGEIDNKCCECGCDLADVSAEYDELGMDDLVDNLNYECKALSKDLNFFKVTVRSGYYTGVQLFVEDGDWGHGDPAELDEEECYYYYGLSQSAAQALWDKEMAIVKEGMRKIAENWGMMELACIGVFSNGEAVYSKVA